MEHYQIPRVLVSAGQGRSGKTTFTLGLLSALRAEGYQVQPFKKGPDYIDPSWMTFASGNACRNLDMFMMDGKQVKSTFVKHSLSKDISLVEGAMGLFDGLDIEGSNSTAELAYLLQAPIILVVNCQRITRSVAAIINGIVNFDERLHFGGVILNNVARPRHNDIMRGAVEKYCDVEVLGVLPKSADIEIPDRHLGLIPAGEQAMLSARVDKIGQMVKENVNLQRIIAIANGAEKMEAKISERPIEIKEDAPTIAVIKDRAFSFYYPENLEALNLSGAKTVFVDSMADAHLPQVDGIYIGGGFPEIMAKEIAENKSLMQEIKSCAEKGIPIYAECGGLMYLAKNLITLDGEAYPMVGIFDCDVKMEKKPQGHGYAIQEATENQGFFDAGTKITGHEFHNSKVVNLDSKNASFAYKTLRGKGIAEGFDGLVYQNTLACYHHLHASSVENWASNFVNLCQMVKNSRE